MNHDVLLATGLSLVIDPPIRLSVLQKHCLPNPKNCILNCWHTAISWIILLLELMLLFLALGNKWKIHGWFLKRQSLTLITSEPVICHLIVPIHLGRRRWGRNDPRRLTQLSAYLGDKLLWVNPGEQLSTTEPLAHTPSGRGKRIRRARVRKALDTV